MINYLGKFLPNLAEETAPLRILLRKENEFVMKKPQTDAVESLQKKLTSTPVLKFYNPEAPIKIRSDSSSERLGAMLQQHIDNEWHPIAFASRSLTKAEQNYAHI